MSRVRQLQLDESVSVRQFLIENSSKIRRIDLHATHLKRFVHKLKLEKSALRRNPKRRKFLRLKPEIRKRRTRRRMTVYHDDYEYSLLNPLLTKEIVMPRTHYRYKPVDGYQYGISFWVTREEDDWVRVGEENDWEKGKNKEDLTVLRYRVTLKFMYRLRNGLFIQQRSVPWDIPFVFGSILNTNNSAIDDEIPVGLAALITGFGIPDTCKEAMLRDISGYSPPHPTASYVLCMEIHITTWQLEGEDVLETQLRANVDWFSRSHHVDVNIIKNEANLCPLNINIDKGKNKEEEKEEKDCCSICLEELKGYDANLPCSHVYHYDCIFKWMSEYNHCPLCRHPYRRFDHPLSFLPYLDVINFCK